MFSDRIASDDDNDDDDDDDDDDKHVRSHCVLYLRDIVPHLQRERGRGYKEEEKIHNKMILVFQAFRQIRTPLDRVASATEESLQISGWVG
ncbi:hypothetical protein PoB_002586700 [Plakobranchus ocellatus]|uniref:Uncharacterized protein n=1 Tax=Plakobranchus ocellatus TaxID=259542 RepID=A0AAV3ZWA1_9GAST|nr:hypothetical protein PoB_002586700 [Plakobranchus ocellatus]